MKRAARITLGAALVLLSLTAYTVVASRTNSGIPLTLVSEEHRADRIVIEKSNRKMYLYRKNLEIASYDISLGNNADAGPKRVEGDARTPEGAYSIDFKNQRSRYHLSLRISYPSVEQKKQAEAKGQSPGGDIMIHGVPNGWAWAAPLFSNFDWTDGCIALTNQEIREVWSLVPIGTKIELHS